MGMLEGRSAVVTGSGRGIGRCVAEALAREGAKVVINDIDPEPAAEAVESCKSLGGDAMACIGSVTDPEFTDELVKTAAETFGTRRAASSSATWEISLMQPPESGSTCAGRCPVAASIASAKLEVPVLGVPVPRA